ncbi:PREDICTED: uncharacterized protein LOC109236904 [Nicotiana attenuata]|uniref:uncharacterized protein LOC109236904 n=1 Tax=Nicotiana attenuata TaxID=49451 RepID=UPI000904D76F|nr:PREDICTED: uncharacterized protein LOC109236904 [Nicotiana attenuata]
MDDIKDELVYWKTAVICYVLGSNPHLTVIDGYFRRILGGLGIDKIAQINRRVFLIRFHTVESRTQVIEEGVQMFDKKPIVVKPWEPDVDVSKENVDRIPVWIRLKGLDIKYWGKNALTKIAGLIGKPLKVDRATTNKERLAFARVLVELSINQQYPKQVMFENEVGENSKARDCRKLHREEAETRRKQLEQGEKATEGPIQNKENKRDEGKAKEKVSEKATEAPIQNKENKRDEGKDKGKVSEKQQNNPMAITTRNTFEVLNKGGDIEELRQNKASSSNPKGEVVVKGPGHGRGGARPLPNG